MNLLAVENARSVWWMSLEDINPRGLDVIPMLGAVQQHYNFQKYPTKSEEIFNAQGGIVFGNGSFKLEDNRQIAIKNFTVYRDGLVADTGDSTESSDLFLVNVLAFLVVHHGLTFSVDMVTRRSYVSELVVRTKLDLNSINGRFKKFSDLLADAVSTSFQYEANCIRFGTDPTLPGSPAEFKFERRAGVGFPEGRYYSQCPTTTDEHLEILRAFEEIFDVSGDPNASQRLS
jgi:hypothetical protein